MNLDDSTKNEDKFQNKHQIQLSIRRFTTKYYSKELELQFIRMNEMSCKKLLKEIVPRLRRRRNQVNVHGDSAETVNTQISKEQKKLQ
ncbi:hypothetical protein PIROE2DRAFT_16595 [Piromyces sp. E2]|nr:hypothetical protein PIROE2DRAFT_16595 [Piromyces sp. E2]|eukprot:OUM58202.1 hypothetical protein PIROE2DRAFT_16595 [Piromyces sp. E2]